MHKAQITLYFLPCTAIPFKKHNTFFSRNRCFAGASNFSRKTRATEKNRLPPLPPLLLFMHPSISITIPLFRQSAAKGEEKRRRRREGSNDPSRRNLAEAFSCGSAASWLLKNICYVYKKLFFFDETRLALNNIRSTTQ